MTQKGACSIRIVVIDITWYFEKRALLPVVERAAKFRTTKYRRSELTTTLRQVVHYLPVLNLVPEGTSSIKGSCTVQLL